MLQLHALHKRQHKGGGETAVGRADKVNVAVAEAHNLA